MNDGIIKKHEDRLREVVKKELKILIFASYADMEGNDTIDCRLNDLKNHLVQNLYFQTDIYLASDKKLTHREAQSHFLVMDEQEYFSNQNLY